MEVLNQRSAVCFIHPNNHTTTAEVRRGFNAGIGNFLGEFMFDTTRAGLNLFFNNCLDRFPNIKFILAHAGGTLPYFSWRLGEIMATDMIAELENNPLLDEKLKRAISRDNAL